MLSKYLEQEEDIIKKSILDMGDKVFHAISKAFDSYSTLNSELAAEVIDKDILINTIKHQVEEECIQVIAMQQPVAQDLRIILSSINIASELERIGDYAVSIANIIQESSFNPSDIDSEVIDMSKKCLSMLEDIMIDYAEQDEKKAGEIAKIDDEIDEMEKRIGDKFLKLLKSNPDNPIACTHHLWIIHQLERMGDRITNIAEIVVFLATGKRVNLD